MSMEWTMDRKYWIIALWLGGMFGATQPTFLDKLKVRVAERVLKDETVCTTQMNKLF